MSEKYEELVKENEGFEEDKDEYSAENIFWVPLEARWNEIASYATSVDIGKKIDTAMELIEKENTS
jgi:type I restriction enzyme M protein